MAFPEPIFAGNLRLLSPEKFRPIPFEENIVAKPQHKVKKANHGKRPANAKARKAKRSKVRT